MSEDSKAAGPGAQHKQNGDLGEPDKAKDNTKGKDTTGKSAKGSKSSANTTTGRRSSSSSKKTADKSVKEDKAKNGGTPDTRATRGADRGDQAKIVKPWAGLPAPAAKIPKNSASVSAPSDKDDGEDKRFKRLETT